MTDTISRIKASPEKFYALDSILPEHLRSNLRFTEFLQAYFEW